MGRLLTLKGDKHFKEGVSDVLHRNMKKKDRDNRSIPFEEDREMDQFV